MATDTSLLEDYARSRSADAFSELIRRHAAMVFATARRITGNQADAHDVSQECFLELSRHAGEGINAPIGAWLHRVASNRALNVVRGRNRRRHHEAQVLPQNGTRNQQMNDPTWAELEPHIDEALGQIPDEQRSVLVLHYLQGIAQTEVAQNLGVNQSTVSRRLSAGVEALRKILAERGLVLSIGGLAALLPSTYADAAPASLMATLGKMAITGPKPLAATAAAGSTAGGSATAAGASWLGGKMFFATVGALVIGVGGFFFYQLSSNQPVNQVAQMTPAPAMAPPPAPAAVPAPGKTSNSIDGVPMLGWGKSQETTFIGALSAALSVTDRAADYSTLMGDSALAFRTRWWKKDDGTGSDPSSPLGEFPPWSDMAAESVGYRLQFEVHLDGKTDMSTFAPQVMASIDKGLPVFAYFLQMDMGLIYGYEQAGAVVLVRDYNKTDPQASFPLAKNQGLLGFLVDKHEVPARKVTLTKALRQAVTDWKGWKSPQNGGNYLHGAQAYDAWIKDLATAGGLAQPEKAKFFQANWWSFDAIEDSRRAGSAYLRDHATDVNAEAAQHLLAAADIYGKSGQLTLPSFAQHAVFLGPWTGKTIADWTDDVRKQEAQVLQKLKESDASAIAELEKALAAIGEAAN